MESAEVKFTYIDGRPCLTAYQIAHDLALAGFVDRFRNNFRRDQKLNVYWYERKD